MASIENLRTERIQKLAELRVLKHNPYPIITNRDVTFFDLTKRFSTLSKRQKPLTIAGRVLGLRHQGALCFIDLDDGTGRLQILLKQDVIGDKSFNLFIKTIDR